MGLALSWRSAMRLTGLRDRVDVVERVDRVDAESLPGDEAGW